MTRKIEDVNATPPGWSDLDGWTLQQIGRRVRELINRSGAASLRDCDADDLEQELVVAVLVRLPRFDPRKGTLRGFVAMVVDHGVSSILLRRKAARRDPTRCTRSLDELVTDRDTHEALHLWETLPFELTRRHAFERR